METVINKDDIKFKVACFINMKLGLGHLDQEELFKDFANAEYALKALIKVFNNRRLLIYYQGPGNEENAVVTQIADFRLITQEQKAKIILFTRAARFEIDLAMDKYPLRALAARPGYGIRDDYSYNKYEFV